MRRLLILIALLACLLPTLAQAQTHPSILLTPTELSALSAKVVANEASWVTLKATCDKYLSGIVYPPDHVGASPPNIASGYLGQDYRAYTMDFGLCYQGLLQSDPTAAAPYGAKLKAMILAISDPAHQIAPGAFEDVIDQNASYGIRFYGTSLAIGFDWAYSLLSPTERTQIITELNKWVDFWRIGPYPPVISGGAITGITVYEHGLHYAAVPAITIHKSTGVPGTGAVLTAVLDSGTTGYITSFNISNGGSGYDPANPPEVYLNGGSRTTFHVDHPLSNYYMGYYLTECLTAIATQVDNPNATLYWNDWITRVHGQGVGSWEGTYLKGGGWAEGFLNYGEVATESALLTTVAVNDIKGINLITSGVPPFTWPTDNIDYMMYATWPSQYSHIDEGAGYCAQLGCALGIGVDSNFAHTDFLRYLSYFGKYWGHPHTTHMHKYAKDVFTAVRAKWPSAIINNIMPDHDWQDFLFWFPNDTDGDYTTLPLGYIATGPQEVFARSDWTTNAIWMLHRGMLYIDAPSQGEEFFGTGEVEIIHGATPFIVVPNGWALHLPDGDNGKTRKQCDFSGGCAADPAHNGRLGRPRRWFSTFQIDTWDRSQLDLNQFAGVQAVPVLPASGISPLSTLAAGAAVGGTNTLTKITAYEDNATYMFLTDAHLEQMMRNWVGGTTSPISAWNRSEVYLRPSNLILVYDRTTVTQTNNFDQLVAFHTPSLPSVIAQSPAVSGTTRSDVTFNSTFAGSIITLLPASAAVNSYDIDNGSTVWRTEIRNVTCTSTSCPTPAPLSQKWLTVLDANNSSGAVHNASNITSAGMTGALLLNPAGTANSVVLFNAGLAGTTVSFASPQTYTIPLSVASTHVLTEVPISTVHKVSYNTSTGVVTVANSGGSGTSVTSTAQGALSFTIDVTGAVNGSSVAPVLFHSPTSLTFANQIINTPSGGQVVTLTNTGTAPMTIAGLAMQSGAQFSLTNTCSGSLAPADSCGVTVTFTPTSVGSQTDNIIVTTNAASSPDLIAVSGTGTLTAIGTNSIGVISSPGVRVQ